MQYLNNVFFDEIEKAINNPALYNHYISKRTSFVESLKQSKNQDVTGRYLHAIASTDISMELYVEHLKTVSEIFPHLTKTLNEQNRVIVQTNDEIINKLKESTEEFTHAIESKSDTALIDFLKTKTEMYLRFYKKHSELHGNLLELPLLYAEIHCILVLYSYSSLLEIFKSRDSKVLMEAVTIFAKFIIGLIPGFGNLIAIYELYETLEEKKKRIDVVNDLFNQLDYFYYTTLNWCVITQLLIDSLYSQKIEQPFFSLSGELDDSAVENARNKVEVRFRKLIDRIGNAGAQSAVQTNSA